MARVFMRFPGGRAKAFTMSYDDGVVEDKRLIEIMQSNGLRGTFNVNSGMWRASKVLPSGNVRGRMGLEDAQELYAADGIEVAGHGLSHPYLEQLPASMCAHELMTDRINLEEQFSAIVTGFAYPFGTYDEDVVKCLKACGFHYARTAIETEKFDIPKMLDDWLVLKTTCRHRNPRLKELGEKFLAKSEGGAPQMFYLWGHSYEFADDNNWELIEDFAAFIGGRENIWYATNGELYDYCKAFSQLEFSAEGTRVYNPTAFTLCFKLALPFQKGSVDVSVAPGETVALSIPVKD